MNSSTYAPGKAGVIFEVEANGSIAAVSSADTLSRLDPGYVQGACDNTSGQMGFTWRRDTQRADDLFQTGAANEFAPSTVVSITKVEIPNARQGRKICGSSFMQDARSFRIVFLPVKNRRIHKDPTA